PGRGTPLRPGQAVEIRGFSDSGAGPPIVVEPEIRVVGDAPLPPARRVTASHLKGDSARYQWVEFEGRIALFGKGDARQMGIHEYGDFVRLGVADLQGGDPETLVGPGMRVRGVFGPVFDERRGITGYQLWVPAASFIEANPAALAPPPSPGAGL